MLHEIQLNIIPFIASVQEASLTFDSANQDVCLPDRQGYCPINKGDLHGAIERLVDERRHNSRVHLIDHKYHFSRIYWKNVSHQNLPVTIKYTEMVAGIFPYFTHDKLPDNGKESLMFLEKYQN